VGDGLWIQIETRCLQNAKTVPFSGGLPCEKLLC
jgi:hypothetical protein